MPARGSGVSRRGSALAAGGGSARLVSAETRQKISEALHRHYGTQPGVKRVRKRKAGQAPRERMDPQRARELRAARAKARRAEKAQAKAPRVRKAKEQKLPDVLVVTRRRQMTKSARLISSHVRRQRVGLVRFGVARRGSGSPIQVRRTSRAHRVWKRRGKG